jgi:hypothetical protein
LLVRHYKRAYPPDAVLHYAMYELAAGERLVRWRHVWSERGAHGAWLLYFEDVHTHDTKVVALNESEVAA